MPDLFILGAGFSKAIDDSMPTMAELSSAVLEKVGKNQLAELARLGNNIELWMTYLSQSQPWLKTPENDRNKAFAGQLREQIKEIIDDRTTSAAQSKPPDWLSRLIRSWHERRATVITLNYDTLIERASRELPIADKIRGIRAEEMYPPYFANIRSRSGVGLLGGGTIATFSYLKLHGSTNWYYSGRDDFYGETIFYSDVPALGSDLLAEEKALSALSRDKEALIIPPVTEKTTYFNNETVKGLWHDARDALSKATRVFVIGYSLPISDLGMQFFLRNNQPKPQTPVYVIDTCAAVATRYKCVLPELQIIKDFAHDQEPVEKFSEHYPNMPTDPQ